MIPTYDELTEPLLRVLAGAPEGMRTSDVYEAVADAVGLSEEQRAMLLPSGRQPTYKNRISWAQHRTSRHGLTDKPNRGFWRITPLGRQYLAERPDGLSDEDKKALAAVEATMDGSDNGKEASVRHVPRRRRVQPSISADAATTPEERIEAAIDEINEKTSLDLLDHIAQQPPAFFERLVLDLLGALGYGKGPEERARVGRSGDGGIDGIISLDKLGLDKVYVQAKRWQGTVGRPVVQGFYGALAEHRATRGVMITTSGYSNEALDYAQSVGTIVLIDGSRLAELMIETGLGVEKTAFYTSRINSDYFADE